MRERKRFWIIVAAIVAAEVLAAVLWRCCFFPEREVSDLYQRYCHTPGIEASFVKGFRINDTLAIDATLLHATDSASWERLREELRLPAPMPPVIKAMDEGTDLIMTYLTRKGGEAQEMNMEDMNDNDAVGISYMNHTVSIYHIHGKEEYFAVLCYNTDISTKH